MYKHESFSKCIHQYNDTYNKTLLNSYTCSKTCVQVNFIYTYKNMDLTPSSGEFFRHWFLSLPNNMLVHAHMCRLLQTFGGIGQEWKTTTSIYSRWSKLGFTLLALARTIRMSQMSWWLLGGQLEGYFPSSSDVTDRTLLEPYYKIYSILRNWTTNIHSDEGFLSFLFCITVCLQAYTHIHTYIRKKAHVLS